MAVLALKGGNPVRRKLFPAHNFIGKEEIEAAVSVLESGNLSGFLGCWEPSAFYGGPWVRAFEKQWNDFVGSIHAVTFNSATTALMAAVGAAGIGPGHEVIVTPYTMSATATAILAYNGIPVFADIKSDTLCLDPDDVCDKVTPHTKAIIVTDLSGNPAELDELMEIAKEYGLVLIEDAAQAPGAVYKGKMVGSVSHMTVFSLNVHKHIHVGEGGIVTTSDDNLAEKLQLIRNHGEAVVEAKGTMDLFNTFGFNFRLTEIQAAIASAQLKKLPELIDRRVHNAEYLESKLVQFPGISATTVQQNCRHVYYVQPFLFDAKDAGIGRNPFIEAVSAELPTSPEREGIPLIWSGYGTPLYMQPLYLQKKAYGKQGCPFTCPYYKGDVVYRKGLCPNTEQLEEETLFMNDFIRPPASAEDLDDVVRAFEKVYENRHEIDS